MSGSWPSRITRVETRSALSPAFGGHCFEAAGCYEFVTGVAHGEVDPSDARHAAVTDLEHAPRNGRGMVEYEVDLAVLRPVDPARSNRTLLYEVVNRGNKLLMPALLGNASTFSLAQAPAEGEAHLLKQGFTLAWSGWQNSVVSSQAADGSGAMGARFPAALASPLPITGWVSEEYVLDGLAGATIAAVPADACFFDAPLAYRPCVDGTQGFRLFVRPNADAPSLELPVCKLQRTDDRQLRIELDARFDRGAVYEVRYRARDPDVAGLSFVSIRDLALWFKHGPGGDGQDAGWPSAPMERAIALGLSQSGRWLRDFLFLDFNVDAQGRRVFDGVMPIGAGAKRGFFHQRFAQPHRSPQLQHESRHYPGAEFPFAYGLSKDAVSGRVDSILRRPLASGSCPRVMQIDGDMEQWQQAGCLLFPDDAADDADALENVRAYLIAGSPHPVLDGVAEGLVESCEFCEYPLNVLSWAPVLRALVCRMSEWLSFGTPPPPSAYPGLGSAARLSIADWMRDLPRIPGLRPTAVHGRVDVLDHDVFPPRLVAKDAYPIRVMRVDGDGNPFDGVVLPELAVPIATYSGRNIRRPGFAAGDLCGSKGTAWPFTLTRAQRLASGDSRLSIEERYGDEAQYREALRTAARRLADAGLMLREDIARYDHYRLPHARQATG